MSRVGAVLEEGLARNLVEERAEHRSYRAEKAQECSKWRLKNELLPFASSRHLEEGERMELLLCERLEARVVARMRFEEETEAQSRLAATVPVELGELVPQAKHSTSFSIEALNH